MINICFNLTILLITSQNNNFDFIIISIDQQQISAYYVVIKLKFLKLFIVFKSSFFSNILIKDILFSYHHFVNR
jgi:hypothetical protein